MRLRQTTKGQILVLIILVLVGLVLVFGLLSTFSVRVRAAPIVREAVWIVDDQEASTAVRGRRVEARIVVEATETYTGSIVVRIKKDIRWWSDTDYDITTVPVDLKGGESKEIEITFTPDQASGSSMRGYFVEIDLQASRTTWVMENTYPPRLTVTD